MKKKLIALLSMLGLCAAIVFGIAMYEWRKQQDLPISQFIKISEEIRKDFVYDGFQEIMGESTLFLGLPLNYPQIDRDGIPLDVHKLFVYKESTTGTVIMLQLSPASSMEGEWISNFHYQSEYFNSLNCKYGGEYDASIPDIELAVYAFSHQGVNFSLLAFSPGSQAEIATPKLADFCNTLIDFLTESASFK